MFRISTMLWLIAKSRVVPIQLGFGIRAMGSAVSKAETVPTWLGDRSGIMFPTTERKTGHFGTLHEV
jgi:hypothetical protein